MIRKMLETLQSIGNKGQLRLALCVLAILLAAALTDSWIEMSLQENSRIIEIRDRIVGLYELNSAQQTAEAADNGYLINANARYIGAYDKASATAKGLLTTLTTAYQSDSLKKDDSTLDRKQQMQKITALTTQKLATLDASLTLARKGIFAQAREIVGNEAAFAQSQQLYTTIKGLITLETQIRNDLRERRLTNIALLRISILLGWMMVLGISVWVLLWMSQQIASGTRDVNAMQLRQEELDALVQERTEQLQSLSLEYQANVENDRATLARELHDELGSILTATKMDISWIQRQLKDIPVAINEKLQRMLRNLDQGIQFKRRVVQDLHPTLLTTFGLVASLRSLAEESAQRSQWTLNLTLPEESLNVGDVLNLIVYRIVQESLNNSTKYAKANEVSVSLIVDTEYLKLDIEDNGVGADLNNLTGETHGLQGIRQRVMATGGRLEMTSKPGQGFHTFVLLPLKVMTRKKTAPFGAV